MAENRFVINHGSFEEAMSALKDWLETADKVLVGAGAGLSAAAGLSYLDEGPVQDLPAGDGGPGVSLPLRALPA